MRNWLKTLLFLSAFSPVLFTLAYVRYDLYGLQTEVIQLIVIGFLGTTIPILIILLVSKSSELILFEAKKVESNDFMFLGFVGSYLIPIIARASDLDMTKTIIITSTIILILWYISSIPSHPLLNLIKFKFYKIESSNGVVYTLISRREIRDPKHIKHVKRISNSMLMDAI